MDVFGIAPDRVYIKYEDITALMALRHATVLECRPTTHEDEILTIVRTAEIDEASFKFYFHNGSAEAAVKEDIAFTRKMEIFSLPSYLLQYGTRALVMQSFTYRDFEEAIHRVSNGSQ